MTNMAWTRPWPSMTAARIHLPRTMSLDSIHQIAVPNAARTTARGTRPTIVFSISAPLCDARPQRTRMTPTYRTPGRRRGAERRCAQGAAHRHARRQGGTIARMTQNHIPRSVDTAIVGAGQAGLAMSWYLSRAGREHVLIDRRERLGGGWRDR